MHVVAPFLLVSLADTHTNLPLSAPQGRAWWPCLLKGEAEIDTSKCEEGESTNLLSSTGQRLRIQKIELPEVKGEKKYDPVKAEKAWKDFFEKFPDMGAWEITFKGDSEKSMEEQIIDTVEKSLARDKAEWEKPTNQPLSLGTDADWA